MSPAIRSDVLVVGAGIMGAACAYHLARQGQRVIVVEAFDGPAEGSTGRSFASIRVQWADTLNIEISWRGIQAYRDFARDHGIDVGYRPSGYLLLVADEAWPTHLESVERQRELGVPVEVLGLDAAQRITPFVADGLGGATWGPADGVVDPHQATAAYLALARDLGAEVRYRHRVTACAPDDAGGWILSAGAAEFRAEHVVNAAGGWAGELATLAGLRVPVGHSRRNVYSTASGALDTALPMTIDVASGFFLRSEGARLLFGASRPDEVDGYNITVDWPWMEAVLEKGTQRFPWLSDLPLDRNACWAGTYENTPDHHGIVGADPAAPTWINACGFSGHGVMQAPEIGRLVAEQVTAGAITTLDVSPLRLDRFDRTSAAIGSAELVF
jgi:sarcosine oxidase, subunit beta